jgi:hypothetical protein
LSVAWAKTSKPNTHYQEWDEADQFPNGHVQPSWAKLPSTCSDGPSDWIEEAVD